MRFMSKFVIQGGKPLAGEVEVYGSKNAVLPLIAASLLTTEPFTISNVPDISDVSTMLAILSGWGAKVKREDGQRGTLVIETQSVKTDGAQDEAVGKLRGSILFLGALLGRERNVSLPRPGGDVIGARPIDVHLDGFRQLGAEINEEGDQVLISGQAMQAGEVTLSEFSVTATENMLLVAATLPGKTTIYTAAAEPHVVALAGALTRMGASITGAGTHTLVVEGSTKLAGATVENISDMLEAGFFILLAAATKSDMNIRQVPTQDLRLFFKKLTQIGVAYSVDHDTVTVRPAPLRAFRLQVLPHPGIATDLQAPFAVLATQTQGSSLIHDPLYESRFKHIDELAKMGADAVVCDPHRVIINGPTPLAGREIPSLDIRSGATLVMAGLTARGQTTIREAEIVDRGYARLTERLQALGADIQRIE